MQNRYLSLFFIVFLSLSGCGKKIALKDFDIQKWKNDPKACEQQRTEMEQDIRRVKDQLLRASEQDIVKTLGKPDKQELYNRSQKFFIYYLTPAPSCTGKKSGTAKIFRVRFNSMGFANEMTIEDFQSRD